MNEETILVLGFYDRKNIGDECYKTAFSILFNKVKKLSFVCTDDIEKIPDDVTIVVCGGGDIINDYFMRKVQELLKTFVGRSYAISVGIPYEAATKYLHIFDHVFTRSTVDYDVAVKEVGEGNVTVCPDLSVLLPFDVSNQFDIPFYKKFITSLRDKNVKKNPVERSMNVGVCLAQPYFFENPNKSSLLSSLSRVLTKIFRQSNVKIEYHFLAFNYDNESQKEGDLICNRSLANKLNRNGVSTIVHNITDPLEMIKFINEKIDVNLCMRYHSVMFSVITNTRFIPLFVSSKIRNLLEELKYDDRYIVEMQKNDEYQPIGFSEQKLLDSMMSSFEDLQYKNSFDKGQFEVIRQMIFEQRKHACMLITDVLQTFDDVLKSCMRGLCKYLNIDTATYENVLQGNEQIPLCNKTPLQVARFICFMISGKTHHPCVWGLADNLQQADFRLLDSIKFIWDICKTQHEMCEKQHSYYPSLKIDRKVLINLDFVFQNDFAQYHRSGWSYVTGGLMNLDALHLMKTSEIMLDTYVDRSFHWGYEILKHIGMIPYVKPWYGFIHHTFDTSHSEYNCNNLFSNNDFIESLKTCKGILVLSQYLANQLIDALKERNIEVPVHVLYHPMEFVDNVFTMDRFLTNPNKQIVQIGAWLRNPYGIYALPLSSNESKLSLIKVALKGKEMDQYFPPPGFLNSMDDMLLKHDWHAKDDVSDCYRGICRNIICRDIIGKQAAVNKYCQGLYNHIIDEMESVKVLDKLNNEDYDNLLAENIVFLSLVDCSAVNTVLECIVRNTPIILNRIAALEEILGVEYPGFYESLNEAADKCQDLNLITKIHVYLTQLNKDRYQLDHFVQKLQEIVQYGSTNNNYELYKKPTLNLFDQKYSNYKRFLPPNFFT